LKNFDFQKLIFITLIIFEFFLLIVSSFKNSMTFDEIVYAPAGLSYLEKRDFRLNLEHPPCGKYLLSIPLYIFGFKGDYESQFFKEQNQIKFGKNFYFEKGNLKALNISRFVTIFITIIFSISVYLFVLKIFGKGCAIFSLIFFILYPDTIAHGSLATTDMFFSFFFFLSICFFYFFLKNFKNKYLFLTAISSSFTILTRHQGLFLFPFYFLILFYNLIKRKISFKKVLVFSLIFIIFLYSFIWIFYFFKSYVYLKGAEKKLWLLPSAYVNGIFVSKNLISKRLSFFLGEIQTKNSKIFYIFSFFLKTPISIIILLFLSPFFKIFDKTKFFLFSFFFFFLISSIISPVSSHRYILFIYPFVFIISSIVSIELMKKNWDKIFLFILISFNIYSFFRFFPYPLSYVNEFIKKDKAYFYFVDSNLDWGQGLIALKKYIEKEKIDEIYLSYFGTAKPKYYGINFIPLPSYYQELYNPEDYPKEIFVEKDKFLAISITNLVGLYQPNYFVDFIDIKRPEKIIGGSIYIYKSKRDVKFEFQENSPLRWRIK